MSRRKDRARTPGLWIATNALPVTGGHPFYQRLNQVLDTHAFDAFVEAQCAPFYAATVGRPSLLPGTYFRLLLIGYFEGIDSERGIAWRTADSLALRGFLGLDLDEAPPEHSTISRTRRPWRRTGRSLPGSCRCSRRPISSRDRRSGSMPPLEANAACIVRRDSGETYQEFLTRWPRRRASRRPISRAWIGSARRRAVTRLAPSARPRCTHHEDERRAHASRAQGRDAVDLETGAIVGVTIEWAKVPQPNRKSPIRGQADVHRRAESRAAQLCRGVERPNAHLYETSTSGMRTSSNACSSKQAPSTWASSCGH